jgi:hypothetical protein
MRAVMERSEDDLLDGFTPREVDALEELLTRLRENVWHAAVADAEGAGRPRLPTPDGWSSGMSPPRCRRTRRPDTGEDRTMFKENGRTKLLTLLAMCFALFMAMLDNTVVNVALPKIQSDLGSSVSGLQWIVDAYVLMFASLLLTGARWATSSGASACS